MTFEFDNITFNLLDTPGHQDFSEDTYRTLTAVDSAIMVLDAAKGIEEQTRKLFEVCRLRNVPIITFVNKLDRAGGDFRAAVAALRERFGCRCVPVVVPLYDDHAAFAGLGCAVTGAVLVGRVPLLAGVTPTQLLWAVLGALTAIIASNAVALNGLHWGDWRNV